MILVFIVMESVISGKLIFNIRLKLNNLIFSWCNLLYFGSIFVLVSFEMLESIYYFILELVI